MSLVLVVQKVSLAQKIFEFLKSCISEWEYRQRMNWLPLWNVTFPPPLLIGQPTCAVKTILTSPKNPKFQISNSPLILAGGTHYELALFLRRRNTELKSSNVSLNLWGEKVSFIFDSWCYQCWCHYKNNLQGKCFVISTTLDPISSDWLKLIPSHIRWGWLKKMSAAGSFD